MPLNVSNAAELATLQRLVSEWSGNFAVRLFSNNYVLDAATVLGSFAEASYSGYSEVTPTLTTPATDGGGRAYTLSSTVSFAVASSGTQTIYGWYAVDGDGDYIFGLRFGSAVTVSTTVKVDDFSIKYTLRQEP